MANEVRCTDYGISCKDAVGLTWHKESSAACRLKRAVKRARTKSQTRAQVVEEEAIDFVEDAPDFEDFDPPDLDDFEVIELDDNQPGQEGEQREGDNDEKWPEGVVHRDYGEEGEEEKRWNSSEQLVFWMKKCQLSKSQVNDYLNLMHDERFELREALSNLTSDRDIHKTLLTAAVGEVRSLGLHGASCNDALSCRRWW
jgi:hypothetical protein